MPDSLRADKEGREPADNRLDMTNLMPTRSLAEEMLSPELWELFNQVGAEGTKGVTMTYALDRADGALTTPALQRTLIAYEAVSASKLSYVYLDGAATTVHVSTMLEAEESLSEYARMVRGPVTLGHAQEASHLRLERAGCEIRALLVRMWLLHLDVASGTDLRIPVDHVRVHKHLSGCPSTEEECDFAKNLRGVRVHVNSLDNTGRALLLASAGQADVSGHSARVRRYKWPSFNVTFYGGMLPRSFDLRVTDPSATCRSIVNFADAYGARKECGYALQTAMLMYGSAIAPSKLMLSLPMPDVHQHTHQVRIVTPELKRCRELTSTDLVSLALFMGLGWSQAAAHAVRATLKTMQVDDIDEAVQFLRRGHETLLKAVANRLQESGCAGAYDTYVNVPEFIRRSTQQLWNVRGVLHALALGIVVGGSLLEEVASPIKLSLYMETAVTDAPDQGKNHKLAAAKWYLASELRQNGGANLKCSISALNDVITDRTRIHTDVQLHAGTDVQFRLIGMGTDVELRKLVKPGFGFDPAIDDSLTDTSVALTSVLDAMRGAREQQSDDNWVDDILTERGPAATTTLRRRPNAVTERPATVDEAVASVQVDEVLAGAAPSFREVTRRGWGVIPTSGEGLMCGARALKASVDALAGVEEAKTRQMDEIAELLINSMDDSEIARAQEAGIDMSANNFTVDQMSAAAAEMGYRLGIVEETNMGNHRAWVHAARRDVSDAPVLYVHNQMGHWSGVGPSDRIVRAVGRAAPSSSTSEAGRDPP